MTLAQKLRQEGRLQALRDQVVDALEVRFGEVPQGLRDEIDALSTEEHLKRLHRTAIQCPSFESFAEAL